MKERTCELAQCLRGVIYISSNRAHQPRHRLGSRLRWPCKRFQALIGGIPYPRNLGYPDWPAHADQRVW